MEYAYPMNGGNGTYSYTKNSQLQRDATDFAKQIFREAVMQKLEVNQIPSTVRIADLGCSSGPNTFFTVQNLIEAVENKLSLSSKNDVEFQVFFNDHSANDFNTLFASLPPERRYYAAGVGGSFRGRLFPRASITVAHSSYALHWLSKIPEGVMIANKGRIFYAGDRSREDDVVLNAYWEQYERDLGEFMSARAEEIVEGGLMFLILPGMSQGHFLCATAFDLFHSTLTDLAAQGVISKGEIERFNLPFYFPSVEEVREVIEKNGCFSIERVELRNPGSHISARAFIIHLRAGMEAIFTQHFGNSVIEQIFSKTLAKVEEASTAQMVETDHSDSVQLFYVLKRN